MILQGTESAQVRRELADVVSALAEKVSPRSDVVARADRAASGEYDSELWERLVDEVGVLGLQVAEEHGGAGVGTAELAVIAEILGGRTDAVPFLGSVSAVETVKGVDSGYRDEVLGLLIAGERRGCVSLDATVEVSGDTGSPELTGVIDRVVDAGGADLLLLCVGGDADTPAEWFEVQLGQAEVTARRTLDLVRNVATVSLSSTPARRIAVAAPGQLRDHLRAWTRVLVAAEQLGAAEQALADSVDYVRLREQFGRVIGSFQAIKHMLADVATENDLARSLLEHAVWAADEESAALEEASAMAMLAASAAAVKASEENVQAHGGIGFSWEHPAHLLFRKARSNELLLQERDVLVEAILSANGVAA